MVDYDVFLNHHGPDTKYGLMSNLERALKNVRLKPFLDRTSLKEQAGGHVPTLICNALEVVKVNVAVVSKGYAGSAYCLNELVIMMERKKPVIPILYDVNFEVDLRRLKHGEGLYAPAFQDHYRDRQRDIVERWAVALNELADIAGFSKADYDSRGEAALIDDIVASVMKFFPQEIVRREYKSPATQRWFGAVQSWFGAVGQEVGESSRRGEDRSGAQQTTPLKHLLEYYKAVKRRTSHSDYKSSIDPVHQLFPLSGDTCEADVDVIFFHGLQQRPGDQSWKSSWVQRGKPEVCWPRDWLHEDVRGKVRVLSLEYDAKIMEKGGRGNIEDADNIGSNLKQSLVDSSQWQLGRHRPMVLVGHSFGGLVIKSLVVQVHKASMRGAYSSNILELESIMSAKAFLAGLRGIVFYAVPHGGANMGEIYDYWSVDRHNRLAGIVKNHEVFERKMESLSTEFDEVVSRKSHIVCAFGEGRPMEKGRPLVVPYASAQRLSRQNNYKVEDANHFEVCQPHGKHHIIYEKLVEIVNICIYEAQSEGIDHLPVRDVTIGLEPLVEKLMVKLGLRESRGMQVNLGVVGMGGLGKTTLVEEVYKHTRTSFSKHYFLQDVREKCLKGSNGLVELQKELLHGLCKYEGEIQNVFKGKAILRQRLTSLKVLLVLDDVDREDQLDACLVKEKIFGEGSRVIITSRTWDVLHRHDGSICRFDMEGLGVGDATELFCLFAFKWNVPKAGFEKMSEEVVSACDGLPLSLEVMGASLYMYTEANDWRAVIRKLREVRSLDGGDYKEFRLWKCLKISLDTLGETEKDVFFDIVCSFNKNKNVRRKTTLNIWDSRRELQTLMDRSLVKINEEDHLVVHDQLRDLGMKIFRDEYPNRPRKRSRLWDEGVANVASLDLSNCGSLATLPESIGQLTSITSLDLSLCRSLAALPKSIGQLTNITSLDLSYCGSLAALPKSIGQLTNITSLDLSYCGSLAALPKSIGQLTNITSLHLSNCGSLVALPESIGQLTNITSLDLSYCGSLAALPKSIGQLTNITSLHLSNCGSLAALPESIGHLTNITSLDPYCGFFC